MPPATGHGPRDRWFGSTCNLVHIFVAQNRTSIAEESPNMSATVVRAYASPTCVLLAFDWAEGASYPDFLGFAIERTPGYGHDGKAQYLLNKLDFVPITAKSVPKPSDPAHPEVQLAGRRHRDCRSRA